MTFEKFSQGESLLHRTDTRVKLLSAISLTLVIALCQSFYTSLAGLTVGLLLLTFSRLNLRFVFWRLMLVNSFIAFLWITLPLTYPGDALYVLGPVTLSKQGVALAALISIKANAIILFFITLLATSTVVDLGHGLESLRLPKKLCLILLFSYRYIFVVHQEYHRLLRAAKLRCFKPRTNLHTYRTYAYLFGMTLVKSWNRAERVGQAMMLRGFHGRFYSLEEKTVTKVDVIFLIIMISAAIGFAYIELMK